MLRIGYVRRHDPQHGAESMAEAEALRALGCDVVRAEPSAGENFAVLQSILDFIGEGDQLMVARLDHLGGGGRAMLGVLERLDDRGASLEVVEPRLSSCGPGGPALRAVLEAVAAVEPTITAQHRHAADPEDIRALQLAGLGPVEIARRLGVSRMTVWRKLKALEGCGAA